MTDYSKGIDDGLDIALTQLNIALEINADNLGVVLAEIIKIKRELIWAKNDNKTSY